MQAFAFSLFIIACRYLVAAEVTLFNLLEFSIAPIWVWLFIDEVPTSTTLIGGAIIISAVFVKTFIELVFNNSNNNKHDNVRTSGQK